MDRKAEQRSGTARSDKLRQHIRILTDIGRLAGENLSLERFLDQVVMQVARAVEIDHVKVLNYRRRTSDLFLLAGVGWKENVVHSATFSTDMRSPPGMTFQTAEPTVIEDLGTADEFIVSDVLKSHGIVSLANVPILSDGAAWGVLEVDSSTRRDFSEDTVDFLAATASIIGAALQWQSASRTGVEAAAEAAAQIQTRDVLLREVQHRVKNNFQIIQASISLQRRRFPSSEVQRALEHVSSRINAVSLAHDQLATRPDHHSVDLAGYLRALCSFIERQVESVSFDMQVDEVELGIDRAIPLGLILNEAVTNSIKHAFDGKGGKITVRLISGIGYGQARLTVADNGRGIQNPGAGGTGLTLISLLAKQIGGELGQQSGDDGTAIGVTFPVIS